MTKKNAGYFIEIFKNELDRQSQVRLCLFQKIGKHTNINHNNFKEGRKENYIRKETIIKKSAH